MLKETIDNLIEHRDNINKIFTLGFSHAKKQTLRTSLGLGWIFIRDIIYFSAFVAFRYLISGSREIDGMHFIIYLILGIVPWNFMSEVINSGSNAILQNSAIIKSVKFPVSIIPTYEVLAIFIRRMFTLIIPFVVILIFGDITLFNPLLFIYYFACMLLLMLVFNLISSAFVAISEDFKQLYLAFTRILFFLLPILWSFEKIEGLTVVIRLLKLNPMIYIIMGFRDAFFHGTPPLIGYTLYFWGICILFLFLGSFVQHRLKKYYADFI